MTNEFFDIEKLADGVWAAIGQLDGTAYSNAAIIDLGDRTIVVDTFMMPKPAELLAQAARELTGRDANLVLLTHFHQDHWGGASAFPGALYAASPNSRSTMLKEFDEYREWQQDPSDLAESIESLKAKLGEEHTPETLEALEIRIRRNQLILEQLPTLQFRAPEMTIDSELTLHGPKRAAVVRVIEHGHTDSDLYIELPDDGIVICGDLGFFDTQPFMYYCDPEGWTEWIEAMEASDHQVFVPGHGPVGGKKELAILREYIKALTKLVREAMARGDSVEQAIELKLPEPFAAWQAVEGGRFEAGVRGLYERFTD